MVSDNLLMLDKVIKKTHAVLLSIYMNLPKRIKWRFKGSLTSKQMSRGKNTLDGKIIQSSLYQINSNRKELR